MAQISCLIFAETENARLEMSRRLEETGRVSVTGGVRDASQLATSARSARFDALFVVLTDGDEETFKALEQLAEPRPALVFVGPADRPEWILHAMRLGGREYVPMDADPKALACLLDRLTLEPVRREEPTKAAPVVAVLGAKGGVGATVVACQLAASLQAAGRQSCVIDLDLRQGDVALHYDVAPAYTVADVAKGSNGLDAAYLRSIAHTHSSGVSIIAAPAAQEDAELLHADHIEHSLAALRDAYDVVIVDLPRSWDDVSLRALDGVDELLLVVSHELPTLTKARQHLELLRRLEFPLERVRLVANRCGKADQVRRKEAEEFLGRPIDASLPNDYRTVMESIAAGAPLCRCARRTAIAMAFQKLAANVQEWCGIAEPEDMQTEKGAMSILRNLMQRGSHGAD